VKFLYFVFSLKKDENGSVFIEFGAILAVLILVLLFVFDFSRLMYLRLVISGEIRSGAQIILKDTNTDANSIKSYISNNLSSYCSEAGYCDPNLEGVEVIVKRFFTCPLDSSETEVLPTKTDCSTGKTPSIYFSIEAKKDYVPFLSILSTSFSGVNLNSKLKVQMR